MEYYFFRREDMLRILAFDCVGVAFDCVAASLVPAEKKYGKLSGIVTGYTL